MIFLDKEILKIEILKTKGNQRNSSRVMLTLDSLNLKSTLFQCADHLVFRDLKNSLTILDVNAVHLLDTGNYTSTKAKGYLCQPQTEVKFSLFAYQI